MDKKEIARVLNEIGTALELKDGNPFKVRSYYNAARTIENLGQELDAFVEEGRLTTLPGIGKSIAEKITELFKTGKMKYHAEAKSGLPEGLFEMLRIPGMGPKKVKALWEQLGIRNIGELEYACNENRLVSLAGFGEKSQGKILEGIAFIRKAQGRHLSSVVREEADKLHDAIRRRKDIMRASIAGSIRRRNETSKDIDIVAATKNPEAVGKAFAKLPQVASVTALGDTKVSAVLKSNIAADLRLVTDREFPYALHHFTGSKAHNVAMRGRAQKKFGIKMNEYGLFKGKKKIACRDEAAIFKALGLAFIEPELREDTGEIEAAEKGKLPDLVKDEDIRGVIHVHSNYSDGAESIETLAKACKKAGYLYLGIADHSKSAAYAGGLDEKRVAQQHREIDALNKNLKGFAVLKGTESDITAKGNLDYPLAVLKTFDFVIAAVHSSFTMSEKDMTARIVRAVENPYTSILAHPTGRLLLARDPYRVNMEKVIDACAANGVAIEINAHPQRLDLDWRLIRRAIEKGVKLCIGPDAHRLDDIACIIYGVGIARKGWAGKKDIVNCLSADGFLSALKHN